MKTQQEILDYLKAKKEDYERQVNWCKDFISNLDHNSINYSINYKCYKLLISNYQARLDVVNDSLNFIFEKED